MTGAAPSGVVTFLFTDVEGSTRRWEADADAMRMALAAHDEVLRGAIEAHGGWLFKHTGDGVCAAFASPRSAVDAAVAAQLKLELPVRMDARSMTPMPPKSASSGRRASRPPTSRKCWESPAPPCTATSPMVYRCLRDSWCPPHRRPTSASTTGSRRPHSRPDEGGRAHRQGHRQVPRGEPGDVVSVLARNGCVTDKHRAPCRTDLAGSPVRHNGVCAQGGHNLPPGMWLRC
jgi:hypothetical protein